LQFERFVFGDGRGLRPRGKVEGEIRSEFSFLETFRRSNVHDNSDRRCELEIALPSAVLKRTVIERFMSAAALLCKRCISQAYNGCVASQFQRNDKDIWQTMLRIEGARLESSLFHSSIESSLLNFLRATYSLS